ncbi:MAG: adenylate kinase [Actinobacteria bacterium]|nr:adenylate kinase [Actinomycetota bacterium]
MRLVLLGKQGAGKGTQALKLSRHFHVPHISTGDLFRAEARSGSELGRALKKSMDAGDLVPDDVVIKVVEKTLTSGAARARGFILDGFPRTRPQAEALLRALEPLGGLDAAVNLVVDTDVVVARLSGRRVCTRCGANYQVETAPEGGVCENCGGEIVQRDDDTPEAIQRRLDLYEQETSPLISFYDERGLLAEVDGLGDPQEVFDRTVKLLHENGRR